jgi:hypothetical protein
MGRIAPRINVKADHRPSEPLERATDTACAGEQFKAPHFLLRALANLWELAAIDEPCQIRPGVGRTPRQIFSIDLKSILRDTRARETVEKLLGLAFFC